MCIFYGNGYSLLKNKRLLQRSGLHVPISGVLPIHDLTLIFPLELARSLPHASERLPPRPPVCSTFPPVSKAMKGAEYDSVLKMPSTVLS